MKIESRGVGDTVVKILSAIGIHQLVQWAASKLGVPCYCSARQAWLNKRFPYKPSQRRGNKFVPDQLWPEEMFDRK